MQVDEFTNGTAGSSGYYFYRTSDEADFSSKWIKTNIWYDTRAICGTTYNYTVKYRNGDGVETSAIAINATAAACGVLTPIAATLPVGLDSVEDSNDVTEDTLNETEDVSTDSPSEITSSTETDRIDDATILSEAAIIDAGDVNLLIESVVEKLGFIKRVLSFEQEVIAIFLPKIINSQLEIPLTKTKQVITNFTTYGSNTTQILGQGERAGVIDSYQKVYDKLPTTASDWEEILRIANGRWPRSRNMTLEKESEQIFEEIYLKAVDRDSQNDDAAIMIITYGLRPRQRDLSKEYAAALSFINIYNQQPVSAHDWDIVRAIAYSGGSR